MTPHGAPPLFGSGRVMLSDGMKARLHTLQRVAGCVRRRGADRYPHGRTSDSWCALAQNRPEWDTFLDVFINFVEIKLFGNDMRSMNAIASLELA